MARKLALTVLAAGLVVAVLFAPAFRWLLWSWESNPILRGRLVAERNGCFNCHLGLSRDEIPNPGSRWGSVPRFAAGNAMMYVDDRQEIEEFIRFGAPRSWSSDPVVRDRLAAQHLRMPAYEDRLNDSEIGDLVSYVAAVEKVATPADPTAPVPGDPTAPASPASEGRSLARRHGCLDCHGVEGSGGLPNPGSLGGFIPGFQGRNFADMVSSQDEFEEWVLEGTSSRLAANPLLRFFWRRQEISMPAYSDQLEAKDVDQLWSWVTSLRER